MNDQEKIDYIMDVFEFENVERTMKVLDWKWATPDLDEATPSLFEIKQFARDLIIRAMEAKSKHYSCGGFVVRVFDDNVILSFEVDSAQSNDKHGF